MPPRVVVRLPLPLSATNLALTFLLALGFHGALASPRALFAGVGASFNGSSPAAGYDYHLTCTTPLPLWEDEAATVHDLPAEVMVSFPDNFTFPIGGQRYTRFAFNRRSMYLVFVPEDEPQPLDVYSFEITSPTFVSYEDDDVPLVWTTTDRDTANSVRIICLWCDQYDREFGDSSFQVAQAPGRRLLRITLVDFRYYLRSPVRSITSQITLSEDTGTIKFQYVERSITGPATGGIGVQVSTTAGINIEGAQLATCAEDAIAMIVPAGTDPCAVVDCGDHGFCLDGVCQCVDSFFGEHCLVPPTEPSLLSAQATHDGATPMNITVSLDRLNDVFTFTRQDQVVVTGPARLPAMPPLFISTLEYVITLEPLFEEEPATVVLQAPRDAFELSLASNELVLVYAPSVVLEAATTANDGLSPIAVNVTFSNRVRDFDPTDLAVNGSVEVQPGHLQVVEDGRRFVVQVVPLQATPANTSTLRLPPNAVNFGSSLSSAVLPLDYVPGVVTFTPASDFDTHGLFYWLGSNRTTTPWSNPGDPETCRQGAACVTASRSSFATPLDAPHCVTGRTRDLQCHTAAAPDSWWQVDLGASMVLRLTNYTLGDGEDFLSEMVRTWVVQASLDGVAWVNLSFHANDTSLAAPLDTHTFPSVSRDMRARDVGYRLFRILQTDVNAGRSNFLNLNGLELYGDLFDAGDPCATINCGFHGACNHTTSGCRCDPGFQGPRCLSSAESRRSHHAHETDFDTNGALYYLGTALNTTAWVNPSKRGVVKTFRSGPGAGQPDSGLGAASCLVNRGPTNCYTPQLFPDLPYWGLDLTEAYVMQVTAYSLRDGNNVSRWMPRWWQLQASNDGASWLVLDNVVNDNTIDTQHGTGTWTLPRSDAFRYFRIVQTDRNAGGTFFLSLSGLELYGTLYDPVDECAFVNCGGNGFCTTGGACECLPGFTGASCGVIPPPAPLPPGPTDYTPVIMVGVAAGLMAVAAGAYLVHRRWAAGAAARQAARDKLDAEAAAQAAEGVIDDRHNGVSGTIVIPLSAKFSTRVGMFGTQGAAPKKKQRSKSRVPVNSTLTFQDMAALGRKDATASSWSKAGRKGGGGAAPGVAPAPSPPKTAFGKALTGLRAKMALLTNKVVGRDWGGERLPDEASSRPSSAGGGSAASGDDNAGGVLDVGKANEWAAQIAAMLEAGEDQIEPMNGSPPSGGSRTPPTARTGASSRVGGASVRSGGASARSGRASTRSGTRMPSTGRPPTADSLPGSVASASDVWAEGEAVAGSPSPSPPATPTPRPTKTSEPVKVSNKGLLADMKALADKRAQMQSTSGWGKRRQAAAAHVAALRAQQRATVQVRDEKGWKDRLPIAGDSRYTPAQRAEDERRVARERPRNASTLSQLYKESM